MRRWLATCLALGGLAIGVVVPGATQAQRVALVVGLGAYKEGSLKNPPNDAYAFAVTLQRAGFAVNHVTDAGLAGLRQAMDRFVDESKDAEAALLFYAGHAIQVAGENYLIPVDAQIGSLRDVVQTAVALTPVLERVTKTAVTVLVILDACRNNPYASRLGGSTANGLAEVSLSARSVAQSGGRGSGVLIAFATAPGELAADGDAEHSPFTAGLLKYADVPGLEIGRLLRLARKEVIAATKGAQRPWEQISLVDDFYLWRSDQSAGVVAQAVAPTAPSFSGVAAQAPTVSAGVMPRPETMTGQAPAGQSSVAGGGKQPTPPAMADSVSTRMDAPAPPATTASSRPPTNDTSPSSSQSVPAEPRAASDVAQAPGSVVQGVSSGTVSRPPTVVSVAMAPPPPMVDKKLSGQEILDLFSDSEFVGRAPGASSRYLAKIYGEGRIETTLNYERRDARRAESTIVGSWRVEGDRFCREFSRGSVKLNNRDRSSSCLDVYKTDKGIRFVHPDGEIASNASIDALRNLRK